MKIHGDFASRGILATQWAVWLGCTTARRLADEMRIPIGTASSRLVYAARRGFIHHGKGGVFTSVPSQESI